jgi:hypothetical protein
LDQSRCLVWGRKRARTQSQIVAVSDAFARALGGAVEVRVLCGLTAYLL